MIQYLSTKSARNYIFILLMYFLSAGVQYCIRRLSSEEKRLESYSFVADSSAAQTTWIRGRGRRYRRYTILSRDIEAPSDPLGTDGVELPGFLLYYSVSLRSIGRGPTEALLVATSVTGPPGRAAIGCPWLAAQDSTGIFASPATSASSGLRCTVGRTAASHVKREG